MPSFEEFVAERTIRGRPWPWSSHDDDAGPRDNRDGGGQELYDAYVAYMGQYRAMTNNDFAAALEASGHERRRWKSGHYWRDIHPDTREERARRAVLRSVMSPEVEAEEARHREERHPDGGSHDTMEGRPYCRVPDDVVARLVAETPDAERRIAAAVEAEYGPSLRWQEGDPDVVLVDYYARLESAYEDRLDRLRASGSDWDAGQVEKRLAEVRAALESARSTPFEVSAPEPVQVGQVAEDDQW